MPAPDAVYLIKHREHNPELRYSLRSLVYVPHGTVWFVGYQPTWTQGVGFIPTTETTDKWANLTAALATACASPDVSDEFYLVDDDHFVMEPMASIPVLHRGPLHEVDGYEGGTPYKRGIQETERLMRDMGLQGEFLSYELHVPFPVAKARMAEVLSPLGHRPACLHQRTLYGNYFKIGGEQRTDCKVFGPRFTPNGSPFLSTTDGAFAGAAGRYIRNRFREPSPYERCEP